ncbi:MAG: cyclic nucleotide-binding domain-containing protein [Anaerolineae bacterium]
MATTLDVFRNEKDVRTFEAGTVIFKEGDRGKVMFAVLDGQVDIVKSDVRLATLGPGEVFGEMALVDDSPRSADAVAKTDCKLAAVDDRSFLRMVAYNPQIALQLLSLLSERLRKADEKAVAQGQQNAE